MTGEAIHIGPTWTRGEDGKFILPAKTLAYQQFEWMTAYLQQPDGPNAGDPWELTKEQSRWWAWWYAVDHEGRFVYRSGMLRRMKGWGKDPLGTAICCVEALGPCRFSHWDDDGEPVAVEHHSAWIQTAAVSKDQTRNTMTLFPGMLSRDAIADFAVDLGKEIIYANRGRTRIEAVTSSPRALEGGRATFVLKNEGQHWLTTNDGHEMAAVIARNAAKSRDGASRVLGISNAHNPGEDSDAERDYEAWLKIEAGKSRATGFLYDSLEAPADVELADRDSLLGGLLAARGDSSWLDPERLIEEIYDPRTEPSAARRFYLNQVVAAEDAWLSPQEWDACRATGVGYPKPGEQITLGLDGSKSDDHTAVVGCRVLDGYVFPLGIWDPAERADGEVPMADVDALVRQAIERYDVVGFYSDYHPFESYVDRWEQDLAEALCARASSLHPIRFDMRVSGLETTRAVEAYHDAIVERAVLHPNDATMNQHHYNARRRPNSYGVTFRKESAFSSRKVDSVAAAVLAWKARQDYLALPEGKQRKPPSSPSVYETRGVLSF